MLKRLCVILLLSAAASGAWAVEPLILGVHPYLTAKQLTEKFTPLSRYLSKALNTPVRLSIAKDYAEHIRMIGEDKLDIAYLGPAPYVEMVDQFGPKPLLARLEIQGNPTFRGALVLSPGNTATTLQDLKGKRFAFGSQHSTMSHLVPRAMMLEAGIGVEHLAAYEFLGNHDNVALGVLMGEFDVGAVKEETYYKYQAKGLGLLAWTPPISEHVFVAGKQVSAERVEAIRAALLALKDSPQTPVILHPIKNTLSGLVSAQDSDYDNLRGFLTRLKQAGINH